MIGALRWITYINVNSFFLSAVFFRVCLTFYFVLASEIRIRIGHGKRISYPPWFMLDSRSARNRIRKRIARQSSLHHGWICTWATLRRRRALYSIGVWIQLFKLMDGMLSTSSCIVIQGLLTPNPELRNHHRLHCRILVRSIDLLRVQHHARH